MAQMMKVVSNWSGFSGAPGFTNFFFRNAFGGDGGNADATAESAQSAYDLTRAFWAPLAFYLPDDVTINVDSAVDVLEETDGTLVDSYGVLGGTAVVGTSNAVYSGVSGACVGWQTGSIRNGRRIRGRTFIVPLGGNGYDTTGLLLPNAMQSLTAAANELLDETNIAQFGVWARPTGPGAVDGQWATVVSSRVRNTPAILTSRRD